MKKNAQVVVSAGAKHHAGRVGYFAFRGEGESKGVIVLATRPDGNILFAIGEEDVGEVVE